MYCRFQCCGRCPCPVVTCYFHFHCVSSCVVRNLGFISDRNGASRVSMSFTFLFLSLVLICGHEHVCLRNGRTRHIDAEKAVVQCDHWFHGNWALHMSFCVAYVFKIGFNEFSDWRYVWISHVLFGYVDALMSWWNLYLTSYEEYMTWCVCVQVYFDFSSDFDDVHWVCCYWFALMLYVVSRCGFPFYFLNLPLRACCRVILWHFCQTWFWGWCCVSSVTPSVLNLVDHVQPSLMFIDMSFTMWVSTIPSSVCVDLQIT